LLQTIMIHPLPIVFRNGVGQEKQT
jgi:hypothetical protein